MCNNRNTSHLRLSRALFLSCRCIMENELNIANSMGSFDFSSIKTIRVKQGEIEDKIYSILLEKASDKIKEILPETCGEMEMGYNVTDKIFYFLMEDPDQLDEDEIKILAITINSKKKVEIIKNFKVD